VQTRLGLFVERVLTALPTPVASRVVPNRTASPSPIRRGTEFAQSRAGCVPLLACRRSADPSSDLTELTTVSRGSVAAQWAKNINLYHFSRRPRAVLSVTDAERRRLLDPVEFAMTAPAVTAVLRRPVANAQQRSRSVTEAVHKRG
jgi:hypothetical protein